jgi:GTPase
MMFTDKTKMTLMAGKGGNGCVGFDRFKYIPKGGPSGGDGGNGGSITIKSDENTYNLDKYRTRRLIKADNGADGTKGLKDGKKGKDISILVPCGTLVKCTATGEILADLTEHKQTFVICKGGKGGKGNNHFKSPTNRTPKEFEPGTLGDEIEIELELKIISDVGFVGMPNAGKSTLLNSLTLTQVKIGYYPFTTLHPNISYVEFDDYSRIFFADIPGLIKDAHKNKGLGTTFLRHVERSHMLAFILDASIDPLEDFNTLAHELYSHDPALMEKELIIVLNKCDLPESHENIALFRQSHTDKSIITISAKQKEGFDALLENLKIGLKTTAYQPFLV